MKILNVCIKNICARYMGIKKENLDILIPDLNYSGYGEIISIIRVGM